MGQCVEIYFRDAEARQTFCSGTRLCSLFGDFLAKTICCRLQLLGKARTLAFVPTDPPIGRRNDVSRPGSYSVALGDKYRLEFEAVDTNLTATNCTNPCDIQSVRILAVDGPLTSKGLFK